MFLALLATVSLVLAPQRPGARQLASPERMATNVLHEWLNLRDETAIANFSAHVAWSTALPLLGEALDGRRGKVILGGGWIVYSLVNELALHGPTDGSELRTDLISRLTPVCSILLLDLLFRR